MTIAFLCHFTKQILKCSLVFRAKLITQKKQKINFLKYRKSLSIIVFFGGGVFNLTWFLNVQQRRLEEIIIFNLLLNHY